MDLLFDFLKIILPAALVLYAMYLTFTSFLNKDFEKKLIDIKNKSVEIVLPLRLQAYERVILLLERITPNNLILRVNNPAYTAKEFQQMLLKEIREEFNHNLSQQIYLSDAAWLQVKKAVEDLMVVINNASNTLALDATGLDLAKRIFENIIEKNTDITTDPIAYIKNEIRQVF